jgi:hypothetical protein
MAQGEDGVVTVNHKASARGIKTSVGAFDNAFNFVKGFKGQNPYSTVFVPQGSGVLTSFSENIDRVGCSYSIQETYKYNTGAFQPYVETFSVNVNDIMENEWATLEVDWKIQGSPVNKNIPEIETLISTFNPLTKIQSLGYITGKMINANSSVNRDSGAATIQIRSSYLSGYDVSDAAGYFDYVVSMTDDIVMPKEDWRIEGDYTTFGPISYRHGRVAAFKATNSADWRGYLLGLIKSSPLYSMYHNIGRLLSGTMDFEIRENTGMAQLHLSLSLSDGSHPQNLLDPKYTLEVTPCRWNFDLLPSATIEGQYVLQDLQMVSQAKLGFNLSASSLNVGIGLPTLSGFLPILANQYIATGFIISNSYTTGLFDASASQEWLGLDKDKDVALFTKVAGSELTSYVRKAGYKFGY